MKKFKRLTISLDEEIINRMKETADKMNMSLSKWIRFIAENKIRYFDNNSNKYYHKEKNTLNQCETIQEIKEDDEEDFEKFLNG